MKPRCKVCLRPKSRSRLGTSGKAAAFRYVCTFHSDFKPGDLVDPCETHDRDHLRQIYRPGMGLHWGCDLCYGTY